MYWYLTASKNNDKCITQNEFFSNLRRKDITDGIRNTLRDWYSSETKKSSDGLNAFLKNFKTMDISEKDKSLIKREINRHKNKEYYAECTRVERIVKYDNQQNGLIGIEEKDFEEKFTSLLNQFPKAVIDQKLLHGLLNDYFPKLTDLRSSQLLMQKMGIVERINNASQMDSKFVLDFIDTISSDISININVLTYVVLVWCKCYGKSILNKTYVVKII